MKLLLIFIICFLGSLTAVAQIDSVQHELHDTTRYEWFHNHLCVGIFQSNRNYTLTMNQNFFPDERNHTEIKYRDNAKAVTGIALDFDKIALNIGFKTRQDDVTQKGKTNVNNIGLVVGRTKLFASVFYRKYEGFYDVNTANHDSLFGAGTPFYQAPDLRNTTYRAKVTYFPNWKKFSIKSTFSAGFRQLKSAGSLAFNAGLYHNTLSADTSFIPPAQRQYYDSYADINYLRTMSAGFGAGGSYTIVFFKKLFLNATGIVNSELQWRKYDFYTNDGFTATYLKFDLEGRAALGFSSSRLFISLNATNDIDLLTNSTFEFESAFSNITFVISYRFAIKKNPVTSYIKDNKIYKKL